MAVPPVVIVGLGNPGPRYRGTRHNVGFAVLDEMASRYQARWRTWGRLRIASFRHGQAQVVLAKPMTFMNLSGDGLQPLLVDRRVQLESVLVVHDDLDLDAGRLRFKRSGGAGGHRGVQSLIERLGSSAFPRLKIGIGRPPGDLDPVEYVLLRPGPMDAAALTQAVERAVDACLTWACDGLDRAMNLHNIVENITGPTTRIEPDEPNEGRQ
jgi:peptidyl-tRNA hydrolase, PTH1 family